MGNPNPLHQPLRRGTSGAGEEEPETTRLPIRALQPGSIERGVSSQSAGPAPVRRRRRRKTSDRAG